MTAIHATSVADIIELTRTRVKELMDENSSLEQRLHNSKKELGQLLQILSSYENKTSSEQDQVFSNKKTHHKPNRFIGYSATDYILEVLKLESSPISINDIVKECIRLGCSNKESTIRVTITTLARNGKISSYSNNPKKCVRGYYAHLSCN